jgi:hypothetical protein
MNSRYTPIIEALLAIPAFHAELMNHMLSNVDEEVLSYLVGRVGPDMVLNTLTPDTIVQYAFDNCRDEIDTYINDNCSLTVDAFTIDW